MAALLRRGWALLFAVVLVGAACGGDDQEVTAEGGAEGEPILIGYAADLSEVYSYYDIPVRDGAEFAVQEINAAGGVLGRPLEILVRDQKNDVALATRLTEELIDEGVSYIIGTTGDPIIPQGQVACAAGIPISTGDGTAPTLVGDIGECAFHLIMQDNIQAAAVAEYALEQGHETAYLIGSQDIPYTANMPVFFRETFERGGGRIVGEDEFTIESTDYSAQVTRVANASPRPDVIFTPMFVPDLPIFLRQLNQAGVDIPVMSTDGAHDNALLEAGAAALDGLVFSTHAFPAEGTPFGEFAQKYEEATGSPPESPAVGVGYDEIYILKAAIEEAGSAEPQAIMEALRTVAYEGVTGTIEMDPDTRLATKDVALVLMEGDVFEFIERRSPEFVPPVPS